ncbi:23S rRNA pseudouridine2605 synthase [Natronocella acetinitrilica]|jgi:23S rRNA pseudouridine2605 synthase|uniref:Pseudouridine synthase n=1 Tax=Natronocella acetinitrilica TaxID=414046 RepID=A0AAE3G350_9GAMM|nr:pseudouridine synthase [Natronocella acetinitrilica]MCP1674784.1 23S rRNA pseudouridine2605 synthase [Natronocella acetinitrilica]
MTTDEKLQKVLARAGLGSRRELEERIRAGRVLVNGEPAKLGDRVTGEEKIKVDGRLIPAQKLLGPSRRVLIYHKPVGELTTRHDPEGRATVFKSLPRLNNGRWISIGRLDINTLGLLLLTNDGELANRLMHPRYEMEREYAVRIFGEVTPAMLSRLQAGVELEDGTAHFESIEARGGTGGNQWFHVILKEGRRREVRRLWESQGVTVSRLIRVRYGPIRLPEDLQRGEWRFLDRSAVEVLCRAVDLEPEVEVQTSPKPRRSGSGKARNRRR